MSGNTQYEQNVARHLESIANSAKRSADSVAEIALLLREFVEQNTKWTFAYWMTELGVQYEIYDSEADKVIPFTETPVTKDLFWRSIEQLDAQGKLRKVQPKTVMQKDDQGRMLPHEWRIFLDLPALVAPGPENENDLMTEEAFRIYNAGFVTNINKKCWMKEKPNVTGVILELKFEGVRTMYHVKWDNMGEDSKMWVFETEIDIAHNNINDCAAAGCGGCE